MTKTVKLYTLTESDTVIVNGQEYIQYFSPEPNAYPVRLSDEMIIPKERQTVDVQQLPIEKFVVNKITYTKSGHYKEEHDTVYFALDPKIRELIGIEKNRMDSLVKRIGELETALVNKDSKINSLQVSEKNALETADRYEHVYYSFNSMLWWQRLLFLFKIIKVNVDKTTNI